MQKRVLETSTILNAFRSVVSETQTPNLPTSTKVTEPTTIPTVVKKSI